MSSKRETLWDITRDHRGRYAAAIIAMAVGNVFMFLVPLVSQRTIDAVVDDNLGGLTPFQALSLAALAVVGLTGIAGAFHFLRVRWAAIASEAISRALRERLYTHLEHLPASYHDKADTGDLVQRCTSDVETLRVFLNGQVVEIGRSALLLTTVIPILFWLNWRMAVVSLALFPVIIAFAAYFFNRVKYTFNDMDEAEGHMTTALQENLTGVRVVRAFSAQDYENEKFGERNREYRDKMYRMMRLLAWYWSVSDLTCMIQQGAVLIAGAWWLARGQLSVGTLFAFLAYEAMVIWPVRHMGRVLADTGKAIVALGRVHVILQEPIETHYDPEPGVTPAPITGHIAINDLTFAYDEDSELVLRDVSLELHAGETLAILGPPGSGKSTLMHLLLRFYDYQQGSVRLDGRELSELPRRFVRSNVAAVLQEPFLYSRTVHANIALGRGDGETDGVKDVARAANVHEDIEGFTKGYETMVGERGVTLSGGQRQRVAIARALLAEAPILVLDDALSAVDTRTEANILDVLRKRRGQQTTIIVTHRLSSAVGADQIIVLEHGRIVQRGTHKELVGTEGPYQRLWTIQGALEDELEQELRRGA